MDIFTDLFALYGMSLEYRLEHALENMVKIWQLTQEDHPSIWRIEQLAAEILMENGWWKEG